MIRALKSLLLWTALLIATPAAFSSPAMLTCSDLFGSQAKYDAPTAFSFRFTEKNLEQMKHMYHQLPVPAIIDNILHNRDANSSLIQQEAPTYFVWNQARNTFMSVNPTYTTAEQVVGALHDGNVQSLKNAKGGIALITWYVHDVARTDAKKMSDLEKDGSRYLVSILDLQQSDLPYLRDLRTMAMNYLIEKFGVQEGKDKIGLYFHFPYAFDTSTLHLHARVNKEPRPMEVTKSYSIDEVIAYLEAGKRIQDLILDRQRRLGTFYFSKDSAKVLSTLEGTLEEVPNPFFVKPEPPSCSGSNCEVAPTKTAS